MRVLIDTENNRLLDRVPTIQDQFPVAPPLKWVQANPAITNDWVLIGETPVPPQASPPLTGPRLNDRIKAAARAVILARYPAWKQANMTARAVELVEIGPLNRSPSQDAELESLRAAWAWVKSVRAKSDAAEAAGTQPDDIVWPT